MRRLTMALGVMAAVLLVAGVSAQKNHDFTGTWTADADKNGPAPAGARGGRGGGASDFTVTMDDKTMNIKTTRGQTESTTSYKLDGSDSKNASVGRNGGADEISNAKWDGDKLVIVTKTANGNRSTRYFMDGADLVREIQNPGATDWTRTSFKKKM